MDPISNVDQIVLILRQRLLERARTSAGRRNSSQEGARGIHARTSIQELAAVESIDDRQLKRALIQGILTEQLGSALINEAKFQQVVDRVTDTIEADAQGSSLLSGLVTELRAQAR